MTKEVEILRNALKEIKAIIGEGKTEGVYTIAHLAIEEADKVRDEG